MMIARMHPVITIYTVRGGQRKTRNHVINFPQNVTRFANALPFLPDEIPLIVRRERPDGVGHYDFRVRRGIVRADLQWLKANNKWYRDIMIDEARLEALPEDGNLQCIWEEEVIPNNDMQDVQQPLQDEMGMSLAG
jgi:hypothetical protein